MNYNLLMQLQLYPLVQKTRNQHQNKYINKETVDLQSGGRQLVFSITDMDLICLVWPRPPAVILINQAFTSNFIISRSNHRWLYFFGLQIWKKSNISGNVRCQIIVSLVDQVINYSWLAVNLMRFKWLANYNKAMKSWCL